MSRPGSTRAGSARRTLNPSGLAVRPRSADAVARGPTHRRCSARRGVGPARADCIRYERAADPVRVRDGRHVGFQVWGARRGPDVIDVLEFNSGLMISIDETWTSPTGTATPSGWPAFSRLIRFDAGGLGLSDPLPAGTDPSIEGWGRDALAVLDAAGCESAVVLAPNAGAMPALWLAATHPERVRSLVLRERDGAGRLGRGLHLRGLARADRSRRVTSTCRSSTTACPRTSRTSPPAWPTGSASASGGSGRRRGGPAPPRRPPSTWSRSRPTCAGACPR